MKDDTNQEPFVIKPFPTLKVSLNTQIESLNTTESIVLSEWLLSLNKKGNFQKSSVWDTLTSSSSSLSNTMYLAIDSES